MAQNFDDFNGNQPGDTVKGVQRIVDVVKGENEASGKLWPALLPLGSDAVSTIRNKCEQTLRDLEVWEAFAKSTDIYLDIFHVVHRICTQCGALGLYDSLHPPLRSAIRGMPIGKE